MKKKRKEHVCFNHCIVKSSDSEEYKTGRDITGAFTKDFREEHTLGKFYILDFRGMGPFTGLKKAQSECLLSTTQSLNHL